MFGTGLLSTLLRPWQTAGLAGRAQVAATRSVQSRPCLLPSNDQVREAEKALVLGDCALVQSEDGLTADRADALEAIAANVAHYWPSAIRPDVVSGEEPLLLMGYGDATGGFRGAGVSHFEHGVASFASGRPPSKISLLPMCLYEGDDHFANLYAKSSKLFTAWQKLINLGEISFFPKTSAEIQLRKTAKTKFRFSGDFQILKSLNNMSLYTGPIWCTCQGDELNYWPPNEMANWAAVEHHLTKSNHKCVIKSLRKICELNGYSYEILTGKPFKPFSCGMPNCKEEHKWTTEATWRAWMSEMQQLEPNEYKKVASNWGCQHLRHYPGYAPLLWDEELGMLLFSCDILHLIFINYFKMHLEVLLWMCVAAPP